jgi:hypothetical protein
MPYLTTTRGSSRLDGWIMIMKVVVARVCDVESIVSRPLLQFVPSATSRIIIDIIMDLCGNGPPATRMY